jgi:hypothetical protein
MKNSDAFILLKSEGDKIEITQQQVQEYQKILETTIFPKPNHILYEINLLDGSIIPAEFDKPAVLLWEDAVRGTWSSNKELTKKPNCVYISAMNIENAKKHLRKLGI